MRHKVYGKHLGRDKNQRTALLRGLVRSLLLHESITTTKAKADAIKGLMDRLIVKSKEKTNASLNIVHSNLPDAEIGKKLIEEIAPRYQKRTSGFTRIVKVGRRLGDGALMVKMSLIEADELSHPDKSGRVELFSNENKIEPEQKVKKSKEKVKKNKELKKEKVIESKEK